MAATFGYDPQFASDVWEMADSLRIGCELRKDGGQFGSVVQVRVPASNSTAPYEKGAAIFEAETDDPSDPSVTRDACAVDGRATIAAGNMQGRVWGGAFIGHIRPGGDGLATGVEIGISNNGSDEPKLDTPTGKVGLTIVAEEFGSTGHVTAAIHITRWQGRPRYYNGIVVKEDAFVDKDCNVLLLIGANGQPNFQLKADGTIYLHGRKVVTRKIAARDGHVYDALVLE